MGKCVFLLFVITLSATVALDVTCLYGMDTDFDELDDVYFCDLNDDLDVTNSNVSITAVNGEHLPERSNADVIGFRTSNRTLHYLPEGFERFFEAENIELILIWSAGLKEIHQKDLAPFTKIRFLSLWNNDVQIIEKDLFHFNPEIQYIALSENKIKFVDANAFQNSKELSSLFFRANPCTLSLRGSARGDKFKVIRYIREVTKTCKCTDVK